MAGPNVKGRTDAGGCVVIVKAVAGTPGPKRIIQDLTPTVGATNYLTVAEQTAGSLETRLRTFANTPMTCDENGAIQVAPKTAGSLVGPRRALANTLVRTDENGYLLVAYKTVGALSAPVNLFNLMGRTDENGYLLIAEGV